MKKILLLLFIGLTPLSSLAQQKSCCKASSQENPVLKSIMTRTSIRKYEPRAISPDTIETLLRAGMAAPTAINKQPWHFVVVTNREKLEKMGGRAAGAPLAILVCGDMNIARKGHGFDYWVQDCSAATENILLAAHAMGLGAVWTGGYPGNRYKLYQELLSLPEHIVPLNAIAIGYPAENPEPKNKWDAQKITFIKSAD